MEQNPGVSLQDVRGNIQQDIKVGNESVSDYSYNWPYDYFSTIEMCKLTSAVELGPAKLTDDADK
jgi:hypothetical protein